MQVLYCLRCFLKLQTRPMYKCCHTAHNGTLPWYAGRISVAAATFTTPS